MSIDIDIQQVQQALLAANDPQGAALLDDPFTDVTLYPTPFLRRYHIYRLLYHAPYTPIVLYLGFAPNLPHYWLVNTPQALCELAQADPVELATAEEASRYAMMFLEVTRDMTMLVYPINSVEEIIWYPMLTAAQAQVRDALQEKYRSILAPPAAEATEEGYRVTVYVVRQQELECHTLRISREGEVSSQITVLEQNMPTVIGV